VVTGVLLGVVLVVMVGGSARTMQDVGWLSSTPLGVRFPDWWARWFEVVPTWETLGAQALAALVVIGSYVAAERLQRRPRRAPSRQVREAEPLDGLA
jgi:high-affinity iron transporter